MLRAMLNFLLQALPLALALHKARVVQNAGRIGGQRIQDLPIQLGKSRRALRVQYSTPKKLARASHPSMMRRSWRAAWRKAECTTTARSPLRHDALRAAASFISACARSSVITLRLLLQRQLE